MLQASVPGTFCLSLRRSGTPGMGLRHVNAGSIISCVDCPGLGLDVEAETNTSQSLTRQSVRGAPRLRDLLHPKLAGPQLPPASSANPRPLVHPYLHFTLLRNLDKAAPALPALLAVPEAHPEQAARAERPAPEETGRLRRRPLPGMARAGDQVGNPGARTGRRTRIGIRSTLRAASTSSRTRRARRRSGSAHRLRKVGPPRAGPINNRQADLDRQTARMSSLREM